nr:UbiD family decarboxylase [uncultured Oscillibacter sp.]
MAKDLRTYISQLEKACPDELLRVPGRISSDLEATTFLRKLELEGKSPMTIFAHPTALDGSDSAFPLVFNAFSTRKKFCAALDMDVADYKMPLSLEMNRRFANRIAPETVSAAEAPVKEMVLTGEAAGFDKLPIAKHHEHDGGPYILGGAVVTRDPDSGVYNLAMIRIHVQGNKVAAIHAEPHHHTGMNIKKYGERGVKAPIAVVIGHHPGFFLGSCWEGPYGTNEYEMAGAALGEAVRLVPSETWGEELMVPADAEMILECEVDWNDRIEEGPVGEHTRHYKNFKGGVVTKQLDPRLTPLAITHRKDAYYQSLFIGHAEHGLLGSIPKEAVIYEKVRATCPGIKAVHMTPSGCGRYICYLSLKQRVGGEARDAMMAAFVCDWHLKYVLAVDEDVDVFSDSEVLWALATRTQPDRAIFIVPGAMGATVDPTVDSRTKISSKMGIDCTKPYGTPFSEVCEVPLDMLETMRIEDYLQ